MRNSDWSSDVCSSDLEHTELPFSTGLPVPALPLCSAVRPLSQTTIRTKPRLELTRFDSLAARPSCPFRHSALRLTRNALKGFGGKAARSHISASDGLDRKSTRLNSSHSCAYRMPSSA